MPTFCTTTTGTGAAGLPIPGEAGCAAYQNNTGAAVTNILVALLIALVVLFVQALVVMLLWNWVVPKIWAGAPHISFGTAFGLVLLIDVLSGIWAKCPMWGWGR